MKRNFKIIWVLLFTVFFKELAWSTFLPLWQSPDEQAHYGQVNLISQTGQFYKSGANLSAEINKSEQILKTDRNDQGNNSYTYHPNFNIPYSLSLIGPHEEEISAQPYSARSKFVATESTGYPPLYYKISAFIDRLANSGNLFDRVYLIRIFSSVSLVAITLIAYKCGQLIFENRQKALILATLVGFQPMLSFVSAGVTSDSLFNVLFSLLIFLSLKLIYEGFSIQTVLLALGVIIISLFTKPQANVMPFILAPPLIFSVYRLLVFNKVSKIYKYFGPALVVLLSITGLVYRYFHHDVFIPDSESGFIYKSVQPLEHLAFTLRHTYSEVLPWFWGVFRWLSLGLPDIFRKLTNWLTLISFISFSVFMLKDIVARRPQKTLIFNLFVAYSLLVYFAAITLFDFGFRASHGFSFGIQGRYFFPVIIPFMVVFLNGLSALVPKNFSQNFQKILAIFMMMLSLITFFWVIGSYYSHSPQAFFFQASQYKPIWLKYPVNLIILLLYLTSSLGLGLKEIANEKQ